MALLWEVEARLWEVEALLWEVEALLREVATLLWEVEAKVPGSKTISKFNRNPAPEVVQPS
ncbi:hypothetical protein QTL97_12230 [Sporosarcina thermotolerans]|uniref:Uncharacterized protein n=1 Tax=Sporosarcina thermotolerans TaxID=633404 RepID=A0AAW9AEY1_9BACL|nr:hypothetical protein [Sporosarcina thermotolerans]MDW0117708.1 hypothetical protein [Sporosarcina thermotolerans]WHT49201.1 hypothetical protein QNH10_06145 [Sporosarcina thermotolerans]